MSEPYRVFVVLNQDYGEGLSNLAKVGPVWVVDTPSNRAAAQKVWTANPHSDHLDGVTTFKFDASSSQEDILCNELDTIDLHHGIYSANPPYTVLEAVGTGISVKLKTRLAEFGFNQFEETLHGFRAIRPMPSDSQLKADY